LEIDKQGERGQRAPKGNGIKRGPILGVFREETIRELNSPSKQVFRVFRGGDKREKGGFSGLEFQGP